MPLKYFIVHYNSDSNEWQLGDCLFLQVYILVHLQSQDNLTL